MRTHRSFVFWVGMALFWCYTALPKRRRKRVSHTAGLPRKFQKDIEHYRLLYQKKNLRYVRNNQVFYWMFLSRLTDIGYQPRTIERYHEKLRTFLNWLGTTSIRRVRKKHIEQFLLWFNNERQRERYTIRYVREAISVFFEFVMRYSRIKRNPAMGLKMRMHYPQPERIDVFSQPEVFMLIQSPLREKQRLSRCSYPTDHSYRRAQYTLIMQYLMMKLLFSTGIRPWELVNIETSDFDKNLLRIRVRNKGYQQYLVNDRNVFINENTADELKDFLEMNRPVRNKFSENRLFIHYFGGGRIASNYANKTVKYWAQRCGIYRRVHAYMCRYTFCTRLVENGADPYSLKKLMGHKHMETTLKHYLKLSSEELRKEWRECNPLSKGDGR
jgi:site-specific recombinase XerD